MNPITVTESNTAPPRNPRTPPQSYRLEVWTFSETVDRATGSRTNAIHVCLWQEPEGRELTWDVPSRMSSAWFWMAMRQLTHKAHVALVERSIAAPDEFTILSHRAYRGAS